MLETKAQYVEDHVRAVADIDTKDGTEKEAQQVEASVSDMIVVEKEAQQVEDFWHRVERETKDVAGKEAIDVSSLKALLDAGGPAAVELYLQENPDQVTRIQEEMRSMSTLSPGRRRSLQRSLASLLEEGGPAVVDRYLQENPDEAARIQDEMRSVSTLSPGRQRVVGSEGEEVTCCSICES